MIDNSVSSIERQRMNDSVSLRNVDAHAVTFGLRSSGVGADEGTNVAVSQHHHCSDRWQTGGLPL